MKIRVEDVPKRGRFKPSKRKPPKEGGISENVPGKRMKNRKPVRRGWGKVTSGW